MKLVGGKAQVLDILSLKCLLDIQKLSRHEDRIWGKVWAGYINLDVFSIWYLRTTRLDEKLTKKVTVARKEAQGLSTGTRQSLEVEEIRRKVKQD